MDTFSNWVQKRTDEGFFGNLFGGNGGNGGNTSTPGASTGTSQRPNTARTPKDTQQAQQRQYLFNTLRIYGMSEFQHPQVWSTPDAINKLYDTIGRSQGILERIKRQPQVLDKIIRAWWMLTAQGKMPTHF